VRHGGAVSNRTIEVRLHGAAGPEVVVLHGGPGAAGSVTSLARDLSNDFRVLEPLQRRSGDVPLTVHGHVEDLAAVAPERSALVGWSWGAMLALSFAAAHPGRVRSLVLVGCGSYDEASRAVFERMMTQRVGGEDQARIEELWQAFDAAAEPAERDACLGELGRAYGKVQSVDLLWDDDEVDADARGYEETWTDVLRLQREGVEPAAFASIKAPVLMLHGDEDPHPGLMIFDSLRPHIPHIEYVGFEHCGHRPWLERRCREQFLEALRDWLLTSGG
jgi:pimeloyl-ACP methyl ester carboxylesterase